MTPAFSRSLAALVFLLVILPASVLAQQAARATLTGTVTDPHGAVVAGVKITATLKAAGIRRETVSNGEGVYVLSDLAPGGYELRGEAKGFAAYLVTEIALNVGQSLTINMPLQIGAIDTPIVDDFANYTRVDTTASAVQGVIDRRAVESLPLNGRNFLELALLVPGNAPAPNFDPTKTNAVVI